MEEKKSDSLLYRIWKEVSTKSYDDLDMIPPNDCDNMEFNEELDRKVKGLIKGETKETPEDKGK